MKAVFFLALIALFAVLALANERVAHLHKMVESINSNPSSTWTAQFNPQLVDDFAAIRSSLGDLSVGSENSNLKTSGWNVDVKDLPANFFAADKWTECGDMMRTVHDQSACGSCWAVSAAAAAAERHCIKSKTPTLFLSSRDLLSCCSDCGFGCEGGYPSAAWSYFVKSGLPTGHPDSTNNSLCVRYPFLTCKHHTEGSPQCSEYDFETPSCQRSCDSDSTWPETYANDKVKFKSSFGVYGEAKMMQELFENGPMTVSYTVYEDFMQYKSGIYKHASGRQLGGHAVTLEGWGVDAVSGTKYWIIKNNWNSFWGESGYFRIVRGTNDCNIESGAQAGLP